jgi:hypothetical protein
MQSAPAASQRYCGLTFSTSTVFIEAFAIEANQFSAINTFRGMVTCLFAQRRQAIRWRKKSAAGAVPPSVPKGRGSWRNRSLGDIRYVIIKLRPVSGCTFINPIVIVMETIR